MDMDLFEVIEKRYSHKEKFLPDAIPLDDLELIAKAGVMAPSGYNRQCVKLIILPDRSALQPLCDVFQTDGLLTATAAIAMLTDSSKQEGELNFELEDYSAATENMLLAATALGYVSLWLDSPYFDEDRQKSVLKVLGAPQGHRLRVVLPIGLPNEPGSRRTKLPYSERVFYGLYGKRKAE